MTAVGLAGERAEHDDGEVTPAARARLLAAGSLDWRRSLSWLGPVLAFVTTFVALAPLARLGVDPHHDGVMLKPALDLLDGQVIHRDTFTQYGAVTSLVQAAWLGAFGETLLALKMSTVAAYAVTAALLYSVWRSLSNDAWAALGTAVWLTLVPAYNQTYILLPWSSVYAMAFQAGALLALVRFLHAPSRWNCLAGGFCVAAALFTRQTVGGLLGLAIALVLLAEWSRRAGRPRIVPSELGWWAAGFAFLAAPLLGFLAVTGGLDEYAYQNFVYPRQWLASLPTGLTGYTPGLVREQVLLWGGRSALALCLLFCAARPSRKGSSRPWEHRLWLLVAAVLTAVLVRRSEGALAWFWAPPFGAYFTVGTVMAGAGLVVLGRLAWHWTRGRAEVRDAGSALRTRQFLAATAVAVASLPQMIPASDGRHLFWAVTPAVGLAIIGLRKAVRVEPLALLVAVALLTNSFGVALRDYQLKRDAPTVRAEGIPVLEGMRVGPDVQGVLPLVRELQAYLDENPGSPVVVDGPDALYATLAKNRANADPYYVNWSLLPRDVERRAAFLTERRPAIWLMGPDPSATAVALGYRVLPRDLVSGEYLENYRPWLMLPA